jgi:glycolate oxidase iron-sulfur subunit
MHVRLGDALRDTDLGREAAGILGKCVHCGFCLPACPTYRLLGDELDGPRGRIYLIKGVLEGEAPTPKTQLHLDRCLTCRACETACPSGVEYGRLLDVGRRLVDESVPRAPVDRMQRAVLRTGLSRPKLFGAILALGRLLRPLLPPSLQAKLRSNSAGRSMPVRNATPPLHARKVLLPGGCVQPALGPNIDAATVRVLAAAGIEVVRTGGDACCGAVRQHLGDTAGALDTARRNIDAWWPLIDPAVTAIVSNASACGLMIRDYGHLLRDDAHYAAKAQRISALTRDVVEIVGAEVDGLRERLQFDATRRIVLHAPCTLQHGQKLGGRVEALFGALGVRAESAPESTLCCGSAGTYSLLQPALANELRARKLVALGQSAPQEILSANIGCITHLGAAASVPVRHWIEWLDEALRGASPRA